jgi:hypothetical protein
MEKPKRIDKLNYRGSRTHHEVEARHPHKAVLPFRGKGAKTERRSAASRSRRKMS